MNVQINTFLQILKKDILQSTRDYFSKLFDMGLVFTTNALVFAYFVPMMGSSSSYGPFIVVGAICTFPLFSAIGRAAEMIMDLQADRTITHTLILPIKPSLVFFEIVTNWTLNSIMLSLPLFVFAKIILVNKFLFSQIHFFQLIMMMLAAHFFFAFLSLFLSSIIKGMKNMGSIYFRYINPMFMFGCYFFSWEGSFKLSKVIGYLVLINPMTYVLEGTRAAIMGQSGYINVWICFFMLCFFNALLFGFTVRNLKKRTDCV
ncbi:MAG: hypothetical protein K940chlam8_01082 [Chlamydiae bacterium]|nr:hypothetical protein [Chlamydiota bacterium]